MAFLRSIYRQRATNLVYSHHRRNNNHKEYDLTAVIASNWRSLGLEQSSRHLCSCTASTSNNENNVKLNTQSQLLQSTVHNGIQSGYKGVLPRRYLQSSAPKRDVKVLDPMPKTGGKNQVGSNTPQRDPLDVGFNDPIAAFKSKTTMELIRSFIVYMLCSSQYLVEHNMKLMKLTQNIIGTSLFTKLMKATFYGHFVAGEDEVKIKPTLERLRSFGVKPILDYSVEEDISQEEAEKREVESSVSSAGDIKDEGALPQYHVDKSFADRRYKVSSARTYFYLNEATCERNMEIFIRCLEAISGATFGTGITAIKLTALGRPQLLLQVSEVIMRTRKYMEDLVGGQGNVLTHHKTIKDLEKYYASLGDNKDVKEFLNNVTSDKEGLEMNTYLTYSIYIK